METGTFYWTTDYYHPDNTFTLDDWLNNKIENIEGLYILYKSGSFCEILDINDSESIYSLSASGNGDSYNHKIEIIKL